MSSHAPAGALKEEKAGRARSRSMLSCCSAVIAQSQTIASVPLQADVTLCQADELDPRGLAFLTGQNPAGERAQPQLHRLRALAAASRLWVALVDDPGKVRVQAPCSRGFLVAAKWGAIGHTDACGHARVWRSAGEAGAGLTLCRLGIRVMLECMWSCGWMGAADSSCRGHKTFDEVVRAWAQVVTRLGGALPVAIDAGPEWESTAEELDDLFLGDAELWYAAA